MEGGGIERGAGMAAHRVHEGRGHDLAAESGGHVLDVVDGSRGRHGSDPGEEFRPPPLGRRHQHVQRQRAGGIDDEGTKQARDDGEGGVGSGVARQPVRRHRGGEGQKRHQS